MSVLTQPQVNDCANHFIQNVYVALNQTASVGVADIQAGVAALDAAFDTTFNAAVAAVGGTTTIINGLAAQLPASMTAQQKTLICCYTLMKRAGLI